MELLVLHIPGLSVRLLRDHGEAAPEIIRVGGEGSAAQLVIVNGASHAQLEAALITGLLPEHMGALGGGVGEARRAPFWVMARQRRQLKAHVQTSLKLPPEWIAADSGAQLVWRTISAVAQQGPTRAALKAAETECAGLLRDAVSAVIVSAWSFALNGKVATQRCRPLDRPVFMARGFSQPRTIVGILEVAGMLERELTGETIADRR